MTAQMVGWKLMNFGKQIRPALMLTNLEKALYLIDGLEGQIIPNQVCELV